MIHSNNGSKIPPDEPEGGRKGHYSPTLVYQGENGEKWAVEGQLNAFTYALMALPHLEQRIRFGGLVTTEGKPIRDLYGLIRAWEMLEVDNSNQPGVQLP